MKHTSNHLIRRGLLTLGLALGMASAAHASPRDWESPEALVHALYETISADAGAQRDWDRYRALFLDGARLSMALDSKIGSGIMAWTARNWWPRPTPPTPPPASMKSRW